MTYIPDLIAIHKTLKKCNEKRISLTVLVFSLHFVILSVFTELREKCWKLEQPTKNGYYVTKTMDSSET